MDTNLLRDRIVRVHAYVYTANDPAGREQKGGEIDRHIGDASQLATRCRFCLRIVRFEYTLRTVGPSSVHIFSLLSVEISSSVLTNQNSRCNPRFETTGSQVQTTIIFFQLSLYHCSTRHSMPSTTTFELKTFLSYT